MNGVGDDKFKWEGFLFNNEMINVCGKIIVLMISWCELNFELRQYMDLYEFLWLMDM